MKIKKEICPGRLILSYIRDVTQTNLNRNLPEMILKVKYGEVMEGRNNLDLDNQ